MKMLTMAMMAAMCAVAENSPTNAPRDAAAGVDTAERRDWNYVLGEGITFREHKIVSGEAGVSFDSKYLSYGLADNKDPIVTPHAGITFFDWFSFCVDGIFDTTKFGRKAGYGNRAGRYTEIDSRALLGHSFGKADFEWLPTTVDFEVVYFNEYHPRSMGHGTGAPGSPSQFFTFEVSLPDIWLEPCFLYERDVQRDNGTYLNLELGHTFALVDGDGEEDGDAEPLLALRPSVSQGFGNSQRVKGYLTRYHADEPLDHAGLMDTNVKLELVWKLARNVSLSGYVAYYDFLFDREIRQASRGYEATGRDDDSWKFIGGMALMLAF